MLLLLKVPLQLVNLLHLGGIQDEDGLDVRFNLRFLSLVSPGNIAFKLNYLYIKCINLDINMNALYLRLVLPDHIVDEPCVLRFHLLQIDHFN